MVVAVARDTLNSLMLEVIEERPSGVRWKEVAGQRVTINDKLLMWVAMGLNQC